MEQGQRNKVGFLPALPPLLASANNYLILNTNFKHQFHELKTVIPCPCWRLANNYFLLNTTDARKMLLLFQTTSFVFVEFLNIAGLIVTTLIWNTRLVVVGTGRSDSG